MYLNQTTMVAVFLAALCCPMVSAEEPRGDHFEQGVGNPAWQRHGTPDKTSDTATSDTRTSGSTPSGSQEAGVRLVDLDRERILTLQEVLRDGGYYVGAIDGVPGPMTRRALRNYYSVRAQLAAAGMITAESAARLAEDGSSIDRVRGDQGDELKRQTLEGRDVADPQEQRMRNTRLRDEREEALEPVPDVTSREKYEDEVRAPERAYE